MYRDRFDYEPSRQQARAKDMYGEFNATELYCPSCRQAMPVRQSLLLVLPDGDKYEYRCSRCGTTVGDKLDRAGGIYHSPSM